MSLRYRLAYLIGFKPWDNELAGAELEAAARERAPGRALDIGCGMGTQSVFLAKQGWDVTGVDVVPRALAVARERAERAGVQVRWLAADAGALDEAGLEPGFDLIHDRGCFHDLPDATREGYVRGVTALAAPDAVLLLMAMSPHRRVGPQVQDGEVERRFTATGWTLVSREPDSGPAPPGPMKDAPRFWYRLERRT